MVDLGALVHDELGALNGDNVPTLVVLLRLHLPTHKKTKTHTMQPVPGWKGKEV